MFQDKCYLPQLPDNNAGFSLVLTPGGDLLRCGGSESLGQSCDSFDVDGGVWKSHSTLTEQRKNSYAITFPSGTWIIGGDYSDTSTEFLPTNSNNWQPGPTAPGARFTHGGCMVKISATELLFIGGDGSGKQVCTYNPDTGVHDCKSSLLTYRLYLSCAVIGNNVIVSGGQTTDGTSLSSTEIIPLDNYQPRPGGNMGTPRYKHRLITAGGRYPKLLALGGVNGSQLTTSSIEEWDEVNEIWKKSPLQLKKSVASFGALAVP